MRPTEQQLIAADHAERNNHCPFCDGAPTEMLHCPNRCERCGLPVFHWQAWRDKTAELAELREENHALVQTIDSLESEVDANALELADAEKERDEAEEAARTISQHVTDCDKAVDYVARWPWLEE